MKGLLLVVATCLSIGLTGASEKVIVHASIENTIYEVVKAFSEKNEESAEIITGVYMLENITSVWYISQEE